MTRSQARRAGFTQGQHELYERLTAEAERALEADLDSGALNLLDDAAVAARIKADTARIVDEVLPWPSPTVGRSVQAWLADRGR